FPAPPDEPTTVTEHKFSLSPRFTGRRQALARLDQVFESTRGGSELSFVVVLGEPGMGKSRTVEEARRRSAALEPEARVLVGSGEAKSQAYGAFARLLARRFQVGSSDPPEEVQEKIIAGVG